MTLFFNIVDPLPRILENIPLDCQPVWQLKEDSKLFVRKQTVEKTAHKFLLFAFFTEIDFLSDDRVCKRNSE